MILNSPYISGSLTVTGNIIASGSITLSGSVASSSYALSASYWSGSITNAASASYWSGSITNALSASYAASASNASNTALFNSTASAVFATTGSNNFTGVTYHSNTNNAIGFSNTTSSIYTDGGLQVTKDAYISSSLYIKGNLTVYGTQSVSYITSSTLNISTNLITVNTNTPSVRFGGIAVQDSGSTAGLTGSLLWDSQNNSWLYDNPSGSGNYDSAMVIMGPRNSSALGSEQGLNCNYLIQGHGHHHTTSSGIFHDGNTTCFPGSVCAQSMIILNNTIAGASYSPNSQFAFTSTTGAQTTANLTDAGTGCGVLTILAQGGATGNGSALILGSDTWGGTNSRGQIALKSLLTDGSGCGVSDLAFSFRNASTCSNLTERMRITSGGCVGMGISTPGANLDVSNAIPGGSCVLIRANYSGFASGVLGVDTAGAFIGSDSTCFAIRVGNYGSSTCERVRINTSGVGIGTTTPSAFLHTVRDASSGNALMTSRSTAATENWIIKHTGSGTNGIGGINYAGQIISDGNNVMEIYSSTASPFILGTNATERIRITGCGYIGINCNTPATDSAITIGGNISLGNRNILNLDRYIGLDGSWGNNAPQIGFHTDGSNNGFITFNTILSGISAGERMRIASNGSVCLASGISATLYCIAPNGTNNIYSIVDSDATYAGSWSMQAGRGSAGYGGSIALYGHSHASRAGFVSAGISSGSGGKFTVMNGGNGSGSDVFKVDASGVVCNASHFCVGNILFSNAYLQFNNPSAVGYFGIGGSITGAFNICDISLYGQINGGKIVLTTFNGSSIGGAYLANASTSWTAYSDLRLKNIEGDITDAVAILNCLRTVKYNWKRDNGCGRTSLGLIAQDVIEVLPEVVDIDTDACAYMGVRYTEITPVLIKAIQEQQCTINTLKTCLGIS
jgi:hypothetical protein